MTIQQDIAALTTAVDNMTAAVVDDATTRQQAVQAAQTAATEAAGAAETKVAEAMEGLGSVPITPTGSPVSDTLGNILAASQPILPTMAALGDSITDQSTIIGTNSVSFSPRGFLTWFRFYTRQRFHFPASNNFGVPGDKTYDMVQRLPAVIAAAPGLCHIPAATNDVNSGVEVQDTIDNLTEIYDALYKNGTVVFAYLILGRSGANAFSALQLKKANAINSWIKAQGRIRRNFYVVDCGTVFDDPAAPTWTDRTGYTTDGLHPANIGARAIGRRAADIADKVFPDWFYSVTNQSDLYDPGENPRGNLVPNGMFNGGTTVATSWTFNTSSMGGGVATASKVTLADGRPGQKIALSGAATGSNLGPHLQANLTTGSFQAGDELEASVEVILNNLVGALSVTTELWTVENGTNYWVRDFERVATVPFPTAADAGVMLTPRRKLIANPSAMYLFLYVRFMSPASSLAVSGDVTFASASVRKAN
ncbi:SGNH/GDSL hydrolase family protein [Microvirga zambiensis]|uniref:SGNH/GDSL hydrolase family protein n=1 Tax=Microvirga zambiensis TaxID=1402137 RepID=UPI00191ED840|nr:SGNH/GDSL hydrolase family protein [Microvirga zambiensis]